MLANGDRVGDYIIEAELGGGGMATVYRARHAFLETVHALKVLAPEYRVQPEARTRFLDEAKLQAKHLDHPSIVKVTTIVATAEVAALVMELVDGPSLESWLAARRSPPSPAEVRAIMMPVLAAVRHAHERGVIHRDLKPANILLARAPDGQIWPKVTDFGIAKVTGGGGAAVKKKSTHADARMGTLAYMAPEQIRRAKDVTNRSDIFALGAVLYELATGQPAFEGDSDYDVMERIVKGSFVPPAQKLASLDPVIAAVIVKARAPDPAARFADCGEMARALEGRPGLPAGAGAVAGAVAAPDLGPAASGARIPPPLLASPPPRSAVPWNAILLAGPVLLALLAYGGWRLLRKGKPAASTLVAAPGDPTYAGDGSKGTVVIFTSATGCADCAAQELALQEVWNFPGVKLVIKLLPGDAPGSELATEAVLAAFEQNAFTSYLDSVRNLRTLDRNALVLAAVRLPDSFDMKRFGQALDDHRLRGVITRAQALARTHKVTTLPVTFFGDRRVDGLMTDKAVFDALARMTGDAAGSAPPSRNTGPGGGGAGARPLQLGSPSPTPTASPSPSAPPAPMLGAGKADPYQDDKVRPVPVGLSPTLGPDDAPVTIIEFSDFQCPFCSRVAPTIAELMKNHPGEIRLVYKHVPLPFHQQALPAARAAIAAARQGKFWPYHDALWAAQSRLGQEPYEDLARDLGLNLGSFKADRQTAQPDLDRDAADAKLAGASGTPSFLVNGRLLVGAQPLDSFENAFTEARARARELEARGITDHIYERLVGLL